MRWLSKYTADNDDGTAQNNFTVAGQDVNGGGYADQWQQYHQQSVEVVRWTNLPAVSKRNRSSWSRFSNGRAGDYMTDNKVGQNTRHL